MISKAKSDSFTTESNAVSTSPSHSNPKLLRNTLIKFRTDSKCIGYNASLDCRVAQRQRPVTGEDRDQISFLIGCLPACKQYIVE